MRNVIMSIGALLCLTLSGCSAVAFWLSDCGNPNADLVVVNDSGRAVWSIELNYGNETMGVRCARDRALLESGESYGLTLEEGTERVTVILSGRYSRELARTEVDFTGERLYLTLERNGCFSVREE